MVIVLMGPSGSGKSKVGTALAERLGWSFIDADDHHGTQNVAKMSRSEALTDADRDSWLTTLRGNVARAIDRREPLVLACSALGERHRAALAANLRPVRFVYLKCPADLLQARLSGRRGHFAKADLLESQLATLEEPGEPALSVDGAADLDVIIGRIRLAFGL